MTLFSKRLRSITIMVLAAIGGVSILLLIMARLAAPSSPDAPTPAAPTNAVAVPTPAPADNEEEVVAVVNGRPINRAGWQKAARLDAVMSRLSGQPAPTAEETLDRLVNEILVLQAAPDAPVPSSADAEQRLATLIAGWGVTDAAVTNALSAAGLTRADLSGRVARLMQVEAALNQLSTRVADLDAWLADARAQAEIGLYQPLVSQAAAPPSPRHPLLPSSRLPPPPVTPSPPPSATPSSNSPVTPSPNPPVTPPPDLPIGPNPQNLAPDFTLPTLSGGVLTLSDLRGKPVLINFWATWCPPCRVELPTLQDAYTRYGDRIGFVAVDVKEDRAVVEPFVQQMGLTFPIALDGDGQVSGQLYQVRGIPTTIFVDAQGVVSARHVGPLTPAAIDDYLSPLLEESAPIPLAETNNTSPVPPVETEAGLAPDFTLTAADGTTVSLQDYRDRSNVVLVFYRGHT